MDRVVRFDKLQIPALLVAILGLVACIVGYMLDPKLAIQSYFLGYMFWLFLTLGCFQLMLLHHTIRGSWGASILRLCEAGGGAASLVLMAVLFIPIVLNMSTLYPWTNLDIVMQDPVMRRQTFYLRTDFFIMRTIFYFAIWTLFAYILRKSSLAEDQTLNPVEKAKRTNLSAPGLVMLLLTVNFAMTDWIMSLDPHWSSTIFGALMGMGQGLTAIALGIFVVTRFAKWKPYSEIVTPFLTRDLGNMLLVYTLLWTYFSLSQFIIIWCGNLPDYNSFYVTRNQSYLLYLGAVNIIGQFGIPFMLLLSPRVKAIPRLLMYLAAFVVFMRFIDMFWEIVPMFSVRWPVWTDFAALIGVGGLWLTVFVWQVKKAPLLPKYDTRLQEVVEHA